MSARNILPALPADPFEAEVDRLVVAGTLPYEGARGAIHLGRIELPVKTIKMREGKLGVVRRPGTRHVFPKPRCKRWSER